MTKLSIASAKSKVVGGQAIAISAATNASPIAITATAHGLETGDIVQIESVGGNTAANGQWVITKTSNDAFTLNNSKGNANYTSGGTAAHVGYATDAVTIDSTVFSAAQPQLTFKFDLQAASAGAKVRFGLFDAADANFASEMPVFVGGTVGKITAGSNKAYSAKAYENPDFRHAGTGHKARAKVLFGGATAGQTFQFSAWLEY